jgi:hypothetical protein
MSNPNKLTAAMWWIFLARNIKIAAMHKRIGARTWPEDDERGAA